MSHSPKNFAKFAFAALALLVSSVCAALAPTHAQEAPLEVAATIDAASPGPQIHRYVFGQFVEFVGRGVHDGIWVGPESRIPNTRGFRNDVIAALREIHVPIVRWPGGCYADVYDWRDGLGRRAQRPRRIAGIWGGSIETNEMGTHEFFDFAELIGAEAYVNGNIGSGAPREMADWLEYMTSDRDTTLTRERRRNGRETPYEVAVFGVGNETWGCGGNMRPEFSADLHNRYTTFLYAPPYPEILNPSATPQARRPLLVASGAANDDYNFTRVLMANARNMDAISLHYYTFPRGSFGAFGPALNFEDGEWASTIRNARRIDEIIAGHIAAMDEFDPQKRVALYVDEWGTWYDASPGEGFAYQQNTVRDAVVAALHLNIFMRHADRVRLTAIAQLANVLQSMILTRGADSVLTPTYYVYRLYVPFQDATFIPSTVTSPSYVEGDIEVPAVDVAAARGADGAIYVALLNVDPRRPANVSVRLSGVTGAAAEAQVITGPRTDSHNDFGQPPEVLPAPLPVQLSGDQLTATLPARSVAVVAIR